MAQVVLFADGHAAVAENVIGRDKVKIEVWQCPCPEEPKAVHHDRHVVRNRNAAVAIFCAFEGGRLSARYKFNSPCNTRSQIVDGLIVVFDALTTPQKERSGRRLALLGAALAFAMVVAAVLLVMRSAIQL